MIKSVQLSLKFANAGKAKAVADFVAEYRCLVKAYIDLLWPAAIAFEKVPVLPSLEITAQVETKLSARARQAAAKQASGIVRGVVKKLKALAWAIRECERLGEVERAQHLQQVFDKKKVTKPDVKDVQAQLDYRFFKFETGSNSYDCWLRLGSFSRGVKLLLPIKLTRQFNKWKGLGRQLPSVRLSPTRVFFAFELPTVPVKTEGKTIGIDIGIKTVLSSLGQVSGRDKHGHDLASITQKLCRCRKGSKGFRRAQAHRKNYINWAINQFDFSYTRILRLEDIKNLRRGKRSPQFLSHWTYTAIFSKLEDTCAQLGVLVERVSPAYTSQRCPICGWVQKSNRKGKLFHCQKCSFEYDADVVGSANISLGLPAVPKSLRDSHKNFAGFYWKVDKLLHNEDFQAIELGSL